MELINYINTEPPTTWQCEKCQKIVDSVYYNDYPKELDDIRTVCRKCISNHIFEIATKIVKADGYEICGVDEADDLDYWEWQLWDEWRVLISPKPTVDYSTQPQVSCFFIMHTRATDHVFFGPFATVDDAHKWQVEVGATNGVAGAVIPMMNPQGDPRDFWWIPRDTPWAELIKPKSERQEF